MKALVMVRTSNLGEKQGRSFSGKRKCDGFIAGEGNGIIMLLHRGSETGKALALRVSPSFQKCHYKMLLVVTQVQVQTWWRNTSRLYLSWVKRGNFDEAFKSHIRVALHYTSLDHVTPKQIWKNFPGMMEAYKENVDLDELDKHIQELSDQAMNDREIRNALTTAGQIALFQRETLDWEHVEQDVTTASVFIK
jgi:hypothetical protein